MYIQGKVTSFQQIRSHFVSPPYLRLRHVSPVTGMVVEGTEGRQLLIGSSISVSGVRQQAGRACQGLSIHWC